MKIEFLANAADDCPLIRLFDYQKGEVEQLCQACRDLAGGRLIEFALHDQPWIERVADCQFFWRLAEKDLGVTLPARNGPFVLAFGNEAWREVEEKLKPFCASSKGFNWLTNEGEVRVLISSDGKW